MVSLEREGSENLMVKRILRGTVRRVSHWLAEDPPKLAAPDSLCAEMLGQDRARPNYVWGVVNAAILARNLKIPSISVLELGVAGGNGLVALEKIADRAGKALGVQIEVYGLDTGVGLPKPTDYRDLPQLFTGGMFPMDVPKLRARLKTAKLSLGPVEKTIPEFLKSKHAPIGFVAFDVDLYTSTVHALRLFEANDEHLLPRIYCYFDDIHGYSYSDFTGELLAISEFNEVHGMRKISKITGMQYSVPTACLPGDWVDLIYMAHIFDHQLYSMFDGTNPWTRLDLK